MAAIVVAGWILCTQTPLKGLRCYLDLLCNLCPHPSPLPQSERPHWAGRVGQKTSPCWGSGSCGWSWEKGQERSRWSGSWLSPGWVKRRGSWTGGPSTGSSRCPDGAGPPTAPFPLALHRPGGASCGGAGGLWDGTSPDGGADGSCGRRHFGWKWMEPRSIRWLWMICGRDPVGVWSVNLGPEREENGEYVCTVYLAVNHKKSEHLKENTQSLIFKTLTQENSLLRSRIRPIYKLCVLHKHIYFSYYFAALDKRYTLNYSTAEGRRHFDL